MSEAAEQARDFQALEGALARVADELANGERAANEYARGASRVGSSVSGSAAQVEALTNALNANTAAMNRAALDARLDAMGGAADKASSKTSGLRDALTGLGTAVGTIGAVVGAGTALAGVLGHAAVEGERHARALRLLGPAMQEVERQTNGVVSAQEALRARGVATNAGLEMTAEQLGIVARAAREASLTTGNELSQTLEQLSEGLAEASSDALEKYGVRLEAGASRQRQFNAAIAQLNDRFRGTAPSARQLDEELEATTRTARELGSVASVGVVRGLGSITDGIIRLGGVAGSTREVVAGLTRELRDAMSGEDETINRRWNQEHERIASTRAEYERLSQAFGRSSMLAGSGIELPATRDLTAAQRTALVDIFKEAERLDNETFQRRIRQALSEMDNARALAAARRESTELERKLEAGAAQDRARHANDALGMLRHEAQAHGLRLNLLTAAVTPQQRLNFLQRELGRLLQEEQQARDANNAARQREAQDKQAQVVQEMMQLRARATQDAQAARERARTHDELLRSGRELQEETELAYRLGTRIAEVEHRRFETGQEYINRRLEAQRELNQLALEGLAAESERADREAQALRDKADERVRLEGERRRDEADRELEAQQERDRQRAAMNAAQVARERADSVGQRMRDAFGMAQEETATSTQALVAGVREGASALSDLGGAAVRAFAQASNAGEDTGAAVAKAVDDWAGAKAVQWGLQAGESLAGAGLAYFIRPDAVPGLLASAAQFAGLAAVAGVTAAAIPNAPAASSASGIGDKAPGLAASSRSEQSREARAQNITINLSGFVTTADVEDGLYHAMRATAGRWGPISEWTR